MDGEQSFQLGADARVLWLTRDAALIRRQLDGERLEGLEFDDLLPAISTDALFPGPGMREAEIARFAHWCCANLPNRAIAPGDLVAAFERGVQFEAIVAGANFGRGSSRENAPLAQQMLGTRLIVAPSFERIYADNCRNLGLLTATRLDLLARLQAGEVVPLDELLAHADAVARRVLTHGGLFAYSRARAAGLVSPPLPRATPRPQTMVERIIARHAAGHTPPAPLPEGKGEQDGDGSMAPRPNGVWGPESPEEPAARLAPRTGDLGEQESRAPTANSPLAPLPFREGAGGVGPGDAVELRIEGVRFSHDGFSYVVDELFRREFGEDARVTEPETCLAFFDHRPFIQQPAVQTIAARQEAFAHRQGIRYYPAFSGICHEIVSKDYARPGMVIMGTDSHTCTSGVMGALAFGVGFTEYTNALRTRDTLLAVPDTVRFEFHGRRATGVMAKDVVLYLLAQPYVKEGRSIGQVFEFGGAGLEDWPLDELAVLTNMAVEGGAFTGIVEPTAAVRAHLAERHGLDSATIDELVANVLPDRDAEYLARFDIDLDTLEPMVALPGDPCNGVPLPQVRGTRLDKAFVGSCTGGKLEDLRAVAAVLRSQRVAEGVQLYVQAASAAVYAQAQREGLEAVFLAAGARAFLESACGACGGSGPGMAESEDEVILSATNRNFVGRMGQGNRQTYLASPAVVAASAVLGHIGAPADLPDPAPAAR